MERGDNTHTLLDQKDVFTLLPLKSSFLLTTRLTALLLFPSTPSLSALGSREGVGQPTSSSGEEGVAEGCPYLPSPFPRVIWVIMWLIDSAKKPPAPHLTMPTPFRFDTIECLIHPTPCQGDCAPFVLTFWAGSPALPSLFTPAYV